MNKQLEEEEIISAFRYAQELWNTGMLPQRKQLINLYLEKVVVYSEYVAVYLRNVPGNLLSPEEANNAPALRGVIGFVTVKEILPNGRRKTSVIINFKGSYDKEKSPVSTCQVCRNETFHGGGEGSRTQMLYIFIYPLLPLFITYNQDI